MVTTKKMPTEDTKRKRENREFPGGLVVRIPGFHCHGPGSVPVWETEIPQATWQSQKKKKT